MKKNSFIEGTIFASLSFLIIKFLGAIYVIPFYAIVGELGGALYSYAYTVYSLIINICTIGIPHAISKIISEYNTLEMYEAKERTFKIGNKIMVILSTILFLLMFIFAKQAAYIFIGDIDSTGNSIEDVVLVIRSISFCLLIVPYLAIKRGYLQGQKFITVSTTGEVIEQVVRVAFILVGSYLAINVFNAKTSIGVAIAVFGAFIAGLAAYIYLDVKICKNKKEFNMPSKNQKDKVSNKTILKKIVSFSIPLMIVSITTDLYNMTDLSLIIRGLGYLGYSGKVAETIGSVMATWASKICLIVNAITFGLTINIIPHMSSSYVKKDYKTINNQFIKSIAMVIVIGLPMSIGISLLANEVYYIFYGASEYGGIILRLLPYSIMLGNINMVVNTTLQSLDKFKTIYISSFTGLLTNALLDIPLMILCDKIGIYPYYGAIISTMIGTSISLTISLRKLKKDMNFEYKELLNIIKKALLPLASMIVVVLILEHFIGPLFTTRITSIITCIICAVVGAIIYGVISYKNNLLYNSLGEEYVNQILRKIKIKK
ncbi:MAG: polysaccharide biosynthesis protein [Mollicutes bacterium]|nr:polysaccharide biosynthesis protein [Mollicutes bacterium]